MQAMNKKTFILVTFTLFNYQCSMESNKNKSFSNSSEEVVSIFADEPLKNSSLAKENIKGKVRSIEEADYNAITKFGEIQKGELRGKGTTFYNEKGNHIEAIGDLGNKVTYKYDEKGNEIEYHSYNSDGNLIEKGINKYDENGYKIESNQYKSDGSLSSKEKYKYDEIGNKTEENLYNSDGSLISKNTYKYDENGNEIEMTTFYSEGNEYNGITTFNYNDNGYRIEINWTSLNGLMGNKTINKYDEQGNEIEIRTIKYNGNFKEIDNYMRKYEYDKMGNWVKVIYFQVESPSFIQERKIEYYP